MLTAGRCGHRKPAGQEPGRLTGRHISISDGIAILGILFTFQLTFINSNLWAKFAITFAGLAAVLALSLTVHWVTAQRRSPGRITVFTILIAASMVTAIVISSHGQSDITASDSPSAATPSTADSPQTVPPSTEPLPVPDVTHQAAPPVLVKTENYVLRPSSSIFTNDQDKVDVDTGCPGWGTMSPRIGSSRCGELADLIADEEGIHTADGGPHLYMLAPGVPAGFGSCLGALDAEPGNGVNQVDVSDLRIGDRICVRTDKRNVALVLVGDVTTDTLGQLARLTVSFTVWEP